MDLPCRKVGEGEEGWRKEGKGVGRKDGGEGCNASALNIIITPTFSLVNDKCDSIDNL